MKHSFFIIFDIGGVLVSRSGHAHSIAEYLRHEGLGPINDARLNEAYWAYRNLYDLGCTSEKYWGPVLAAGGATPTIELYDTLAKLDGQLSSKISSDAVSLLKKIKHAGYGLGILSNAPTAMRDAVTATDWFVELFNFGVFSCDIKTAKPAAEIYEFAKRLAYEKTQSENTTIIYFDDRPENVDGARSAKMDAYLWNGPDHAAAVIKSLN